jgi:hypothetical protein
MDTDQRKAEILAKNEKLMRENKLNEKELAILVVPYMLRILDEATPEEQFELSVVFDATGKKGQVVIDEWIEPDPDLQGIEQKKPTGEVEEAVEITINAYPYLVDYITRKGWLGKAN